MNKNPRKYKKICRLTVQVAVQRQEVWPVRAAERRVDVFWQGGGHPGQGGALGEAALRRRLLFVPSSAVLKPNLQRISEREGGVSLMPRYAGRVSGSLCGRCVYFSSSPGGSDPISVKGVNV